MKLTDSQREAVELGLGDMQLIACAGSGKTEVVAGEWSGSYRRDGQILWCLRTS